MRLKVTDNGGATDFAVRTLTVINNQPPSASFTFSPDLAGAGRISDLRGGASVFLQVEDRALADLRVLLHLLAGGLGLLEHLEHSLARRAGRVERAALDQRLDRLLVDGAAVDALAEVPDRGERAVLLARALDRLDRLVADALDRVEAEADVALDDDEARGRRG